MTSGVVASMAVAASFTLVLAGISHVIFPGSHAASLAFNPAIRFRPTIIRLAMSFLGIVEVFAGATVLIALSLASEYLLVRSLTVGAALYGIFVLYTISSLALSVPTSTPCACGLGPGSLSAWTAARAGIFLAACTVAAFDSASIASIGFASRALASASGVVIAALVTGQLILISADQADDLSSNISAKYLSRS